MDAVPSRQPILASAIIVTIITFSTARTKGHEKYDAQMTAFHKLFQDTDYLPLPQWKVHIYRAAHESLTGMAKSQTLLLYMWFAGPAKAKLGAAKDGLQSVTAILWVSHLSACCCSHPAAGMPARPGLPRVRTVDDCPDIAGRAR